MGLPKNKIGCFTLGQLPTSYRESMSYEEQILWLCNIIENDITPRLNEVIVKVNNIDINFDNLNKAIDEINSQLDLVKEEYLILSSKVDTNTDDIITLNNRITDEIAELDSTLKDLINQNFNTLKDYVDYNDTILNNKIDNISTTGIMAYNPTNGLLEPLQKVLNDIAQLTNRDGLTATEFDALDLTATGFDAYQITAYEFDSQGKTILV